LLQIHENKLRGFDGFKRVKVYGLKLFNNNSRTEKSQKGSLLVTLIKLAIGKALYKTNF